jgi:hypothetical protein
MRHPKRLATLALVAALTLCGCQNPDGSTDWGNTLLLGAGVGAVAAIAAGAASDHGRPADWYRQGSDRRGRDPRSRFGYADSRFGASPYGFVDSRSRYPYFGSRGW